MSQSDATGLSRPGQACSRSGQVRYSPKATDNPFKATCRDGPIVLQKSLKPERRFFRLKPTQTKVATKSDSGPITEVTDELSGRSCDPPHPYTKNAPTAQKFSDQRCKRTFATVSAITRLMHCSKFGEIRRGWATARRRLAVGIHGDVRGHAARSTRISISLRSIPKSIGLVSRASAPFSSALRFVSASP